MKKLTKTLVCMVYASLTLLALSCGESVPAPSSTPSPSPTVVPSPISSLFPLTVTDSNGNELRFEAPPERIVAFDSAVLETLFAIGEGHRVVGTHDFASYPPEAADIPRVGDAFNMSIEATLALEPDLVFIFFDRFLPDLERTGLRVLYIKTLENEFTRIADNTRLWGRIVGNPSAGEAVAADFEERLARIIDALSQVETGPSVFQDNGEFWTPGPDTLSGEVFDLLKLQNIAADVSGYAQLSPEVLVERDPELIIATFGDVISGNPAFQDVRAVKEGRMLLPRSDALSVASPRFIEGIEELAAWVYPELFE